MPPPEAEAKDRHVDNRARHTADTVTAPFIAFDGLGTVVDINSEAEKTFGWTRDELIGRRLADVVVSSDSRDVLLAHVGALLEGRGGGTNGRRFELVARRRNGERFPVELSAWATGGENRRVNAFVHDLSERKRSEEALHRLASIVECSEDAIVSTSIDGNILTWNYGAERLHGYASDEVVGKPISIIVPPERHEEVEQFTERIRRGEPIVNHETVRLTRHGSTVEVALTVSPIFDATGTVSGASIIVRDISNQRWMKATLDTTLKALESALDDSKEAEARSSRFLSDAAHQLRSPMAAIMASADTLIRGAPPSRRDDLLANLARDASRAGRLMGGLLHMARLDQGAALAPKPCDIVQLCSDEADRVCVISPELEVVVDVGTLDEAFPEVDGDAVREVLSNLLDNARRHAKSRIEVAVRSSAATVECRVADDGPGLAPGLTEQAFERFVSLDRKGGSGLGLPIARGLARAHGGDLFYDDRAFVLQLPVRAPTTSGPWGGQVAPPVMSPVDTERTSPPSDVADVLGQEA